MIPQIDASLAKIQSLEAEVKAEGRIPSIQEARESLNRFNNSHWKGKQQGETARYTIPVDSNRDDDCLLGAFIDWAEILEKKLRVYERFFKQPETVHSEKIKELEAEVEELKEKLKGGLGFLLRTERLKNEELKDDLEHTQIRYDQLKIQLSLAQSVLAEAEKERFELRISNSLNKTVMLEIEKALKTCEYSYDIDDGGYWKFDENAIKEALSRIQSFNNK